MRDFYHNMLVTADQIGLKILSDDHCCKLLAWLWAYGGGVEAVVMNMKLNENIQAAQRRLNIDGGETPNNELFGKLRQYLKEVEPIVKNKSKKHPKWAFEICDYYGLKYNCVQ